MMQVRKGLPDFEAASRLLRAAGKAFNRKGRRGRRKDREEMTRSRASPCIGKLLYNFKFTRFFNLYGPH